MLNAALRKGKVNMEREVDKPILLVTINARYIHTAFGLRYLYSNMGELQGRTRILEFEIRQRALEIAGEILAQDPVLVGFGVYIWNVALSTEVIEILKRVRPDLTVIIGGPEVSYEIDKQSIVELADYVITGEADIKFAEVCRVLLGGKRPEAKVIVSGLPTLTKVNLPYEAYTEEDLTNRVIYVEASRGCPFTCEFCLSSLDVPVRAFGLDSFLSEMETLLKRGARSFKFVDRTFNLNIKTSRAILQFFIDRWQDGMFLHFEMVPDRMPQELLELLSWFPKGTVQLEVGIQTFDDVTSKNISRRQNLTKLEANIRYLREHTGVHIHADLIVGLPGETLESFAQGFDKLVAMGPQEIQVGILKRLRGTPIVRHDVEWGMVYGGHPPYEILQSRDWSFEEIQRMRRFARFWDLVANSGRFVETLSLIWDGVGSAFWGFLAFTDWMGKVIGRNHSIALVVLAERLWEYLTKVRMLKDVEPVFRADWERGGAKRERLGFLETTVAVVESKERGSGLGQRQRRHAGKQAEV